MTALNYVVIVGLVVYVGYLFKQIAGNTRNFFLAARCLARGDPLH